MLHAKQTLQIVTDTERLGWLLFRQVSACQNYTAAPWNHSQSLHLLRSLVRVSDQNSEPASLLRQRRVGRGWASHGLPPLSNLKRGVSVCPDHR